MEGLDWSAADVWDSLLRSGDRWLDAHVETVLEEHPDFMESERNDLVLQAQSINLGEFKRPAKRKRTVASPGIQTAHLSRCQKRNAMKRHHRAALRVTRQKHRKRLACARTSALFGVRKKGHLLIGTWNTRGMGAPFGKDPEGKPGLFASCWPKGGGAARC